MPVCASRTWADQWHLLRVQGTECYARACQKLISTVEVEAAVRGPPGSVLGNPEGFRSGGAFPVECLTGE